MYFAYTSAMLNSIFVGLLLAVNPTNPACAESPKLWIASDVGIFNTAYVTNGEQRIHPGFFGIFDVEPLVKDNPEAMAHVREMNRYNTYTHISYWGGLLGGMGLMIAGLPNSNSGLYFSGLGLLFGSLFFDLYFGSQARHHMLEAINVYNGVKNSGARAKIDSFNDGRRDAILPSASDSPLRLALSFNF